MTFPHRLTTAIRFGSVDSDDLGVIAAAVATAMTAGGLIGWAIMTAIHAANAASLGGM